MAHPSQRYRAEPNKNEPIPHPWRKVRSNKGNWYFFNPETMVSVWDLNEYLESAQYAPSNDSQEESEFSVKRFKDEEIVLDATYTSHYDSLFGASEDDEEDDDDDSNEKESFDSAKQQPQQLETQKSIPKFQSVAKPPVNAASASRFAVKKSTSSLSSESSNGGEKRIINLQKPEEKVAQKPQASLSNQVERKVKVNPFLQMQSPKISHFFPKIVASSNQEISPSRHQTFNSFGKFENWLKATSKPKGQIVPLEFITMAHSSFITGFSSLDSLLLNMKYIYTN